MKKDANAGLFFLLAVGIVGLGLFYGATNEYTTGEIRLYHVLCWVILLIALLRVLELIWEPLRTLWDQAWGKPHGRDRGKEELEKEGHALSFEGEGTEEEPVSPADPFHQEYQRAPQQPAAVAYEKESEDLSEGPMVLDGQGRSVIIMPDKGARLYLKDDQAAYKGSEKEVSVQETFSGNQEWIGSASCHPAAGTVEVHPVPAQEGPAEDVWHADGGDRALKEPKEKRTEKKKSEKKKAKKKK